MTKLHITTDADCVLYWMKDHPGTFEEFMVNNKTTDISYEDAIEYAVETAVKFTDQKHAEYIITIQTGKQSQPNTIYTVEGYEMKTNGCDTPCSEECFNLLHCKKVTATLKRIEPVVDENDGWISVNEHQPKPGDRVLTYTCDSPMTNEEQRVITYGSIANGFPAGVTHWQPLPNPPKQ